MLKIKGMTLSDEAIEKQQDQVAESVQAADLEVVDRESCLEAQSWLKALVRKRKEVEDWILPYWRSAKDAYDQARKLRDQLLDPIRQTETDLRNAIGEYMAESEVDDSGKVDERARAKGIGTRSSWSWSVTDPEKVNSQYLAPDLTKIASVVKALGKDAVEVVGGIEVTPRVTTVVRDASEDEPEQWWRWIPISGKAPGKLNDFGFQTGVRDGRFCAEVSDAFLEQSAKEFHGVDIAAAVVDARAWVLENMNKRTNYKGLVPFLNRWLSKEQEASDAF